MREGRGKVEGGGGGRVPGVYFFNLNCKYEALQYNALAVYYSTIHSTIHNTFLREADIRRGT